MTFWPGQWPENERLLTLVQGVPGRLALWAAQITTLVKQGKEIVLVSSGAIAEGMQRLLAPLAICTLVVPPLPSLTMTVKESFPL